MLPVPVPIRQSFDHSRATRDLGWRNRPYVDALRETLQLEAQAGQASQVLSAEF
jgi:hypothetical protein